MSNITRRIFKKKRIGEFFKKEFSQYAAYDNIRSIPSLSGLKNSGQKVAWVVYKNMLKEFTKVSRFVSMVSAETEYLHGETSLENVVVNMGTSYNCNGNNLPLLKGDGNFGSRIETKAGAARYVKVGTPKYFFNIFRKEDSLIYKPQMFEGAEIEPQNMYPIIPIGLVNLSSGMGNGFANFIMPRNPKDIIKNIIKKLDGKTLTNKDFPIYFKGFTGKTTWIGVEGENKDHEWQLTGTVEKKDLYTIILKDIPPKHTLKTYKSHLDGLKNDKKVIKSYKDMSDKDVLLFEVKISGDFWDTYNTPIKLNSLFDMDDKAKENFTYVYDNKVKSVSNIVEYFNMYFNYRLDAYISRKEAQLNKLQEDIEIADSKYRFVKAIVDGKILVNNKTKAEILVQIKQISPILKLVDGNYDYLLRMPIYSVSKEKLEELSKEIEKIKADKINLEKTKVEDIWKQELKELDKII